MTNIHYGDCRSRSTGIFVIAKLTDRKRKIIMTLDGKLKQSNPIRTVTLNHVYFLLSLNHDQALFIE
jgi:hypothetical protein